MEALSAVGACFPTVTARIVRFSTPTWNRTTIICLEDICTIHCAIGANKKGNYLFLFISLNLNKLSGLTLAKKK